jgi:hypothetical protein
MPTKFSQFNAGGQIIAGDILVGLRNGQDTQFSTLQPIVFAATTVNLTAVYNNGTNGVGATLTNSGAMAAFLVDGINPPLGSRVLVKNQASALQNGVYTITTVGSASVNWVLTRSVDYNTPAQVYQGSTFTILNGFTNDNTQWIEVAVVSAIGISPIVFQAFNTGVSYTVAGTPGQIDVVTLGTVSTISIDPGYIGQTSITTLGTITTGTWNGSIIGPTYGGTGINNGSNTITIGGNVAFSGAYTFTGTLVGNTAVIFPTSGTLSTTVGTVTSVSGTANQIASTGGATPVISIANNPILPGTGGVTLPAGTTLQEAGGAGTIRFNTTTGLTELTNDGITWSSVSLGSGTVTSVSGTVNRITSTGGATPVIDIAATYVGQTSITTLGTITTGVWNGSVIPLAYGGTNANLTASNGGIFYSTATAGAILAGTATANQMIQSGASSAPLWSTTTWPATSTINQLLYSSANNVIAGLATANSATLVTTSTGVPVMSGTMTNGQIIIGSTGETPVAASLTAGANITITPGAGTITIASSAPGTGTVTSVATGVGLGGGTITTTGTISALINSFCQFRLSLTTAVPVTTADVLAATTIYCVPYKGNYIALFTSGTWQLYQNAQLSIAVPATTVTGYDVFCYDSGGGTLTLQLVAWTNLTTRATAIVFQDGIYCKSGDLGKRYLGSFQTTGVSGQTEDSVANRFLSNYYNRVEKDMIRNDPTASWTYTTATWRQSNANVANQLNFFIGVSECIVNGIANGSASNSSAASIGTAVALNSTTSISTTNLLGSTQMASNTQATAASSFYKGYPPIGNNYLAWLEISSATGSTTFYGTTSVNSVNYLTGIIGSIWC